MSELARLTLSEAAALLAAKGASSVDLTRACLAAIDRDGGRLNAFIRLDGERALAEATASDAARARGEARGALHGIPLAHKDMFYRAGTVVTCGSKIRQDFRPTTTATVLTRLDAAGAVTLGALNMSEFALGPTGHNAHFGRTRNPWNPDYVTGGSSSGSGAAVAGRLVYGALGSDTGGSIRLPSAFCGLVGIRPTWGRVSRAGAMGLSFSLDTIGPLARTSRDAWLLFAAIAGQDAADATSSPLPVHAPDFDRASLRGLRVGIARSHYEEGLHPDVAEALAASRAALAGLGAELVEVVVPEHGRLGELASVISMAEAATLHWDWLRTRPQDYGAQVLARLQPGLAIPATAYLRALQLRAEALASTLAITFAQCDLLHTSVIRGVLPSAAVYERDLAHDALALAAAFMANTRPISALGLPALSLPIGFDSAGLPIGAQLIGRPFAEATLLEVGHLHEQVTGHTARAP